MEEHERQGPVEHQSIGPESHSIADRARDAGSGGDAYESLKQSLQSANPDVRSAAAKELSDEPEAYETLHRALQELGIEEVAEGYSNQV